MDLVPSLFCLAADALTRDFLRRPSHWLERTPLLKIVSDRLRPLQHTHHLNCPYQLPAGYIGYNDRWIHREENGKVVAHDIITGQETAVEGEEETGYRSDWYIGVTRNNGLYVYTSDLTIVLSYPGEEERIEFDMHTHTTDSGNGEYDTFDYKKRLISSTKNRISYWYIAGVTWKFSYIDQLVNNDRGETYPDYDPASMFLSLLLQKRDKSDMIYITHRGQQTIPYRQILTLGEDWVITYDYTGMYYHDGRATQHWPGQIPSLNLNCIENDGFYTIRNEIGRPRRLDLRDKQICTINIHGIMTTSDCYDRHGWWYGRKPLEKCFNVNLFDLPMSLWERWLLAQRILLTNRLWRWE